MTTHLCLVPKLRIPGAKPPLSKMVWCLIKHGTDLPFSLIEKVSFQSMKCLCDTYEKLTKRLQLRVNETSEARQSDTGQQLTFDDGVSHKQFSCPVRCLILEYPGDEDRQLMLCASFDTQSKAPHLLSCHAYDALL